MRQTMDTLALLLISTLVLGSDGQEPATNKSSTLTEAPATTSGGEPCGGLLSGSEFSLKSPGYPVQYPSGSQCSWRVARRSPGVCGLEFTFQSFDLEPSDDCAYDYLQVDGTRVCGKIRDGSVRVFMFSENETTIRFVSDKQNTRSGFDIRVRQITTCNPDSTGFSCSRTFDEKEFFIRSPDYPANYSDHSNCTYRILRSGERVCAIRLTFASFHIEQSVHCKSDYFAVDGKKFCGKLEDATTETFPFHGTEKLLSFFSDSSVSGPGFFAHVQQEDCDPRAPQLAARPQEECSSVINTTTFELKSPGYPLSPYSPNLNCRYRVLRSNPDLCDLTITVLEFRLQEGEVCENDFLQVAEERLCGTIERGMTRTYSFGNADEITMNFDTDSTRGDKGFHIMGEQIDCNATAGNSTKQRKAQRAWDCDRTVTAVEDMLRSPAFPDSYPADVDCRWMVVRSDQRHCELEITIHSLHIQVGESCQFDYLEVDGHRFCGSTTAGNKRIFSFKTEQIVIHFHSDSTTNDRGFEVSLKQRECQPTSSPTSASSCDQVFDSKSFVLVSPNHPREYDNGLDCKYVIRRSSEDVCRLEMEFLRFDVESSSNCEYDYLSINGEKICGLIENTTRTYLFQDYEKQLLFHSDSGTSRPGFMIRVSQVDCSASTDPPKPPPSKPCDQRFASATFELRSDNYPSNYDSHLRCSYTVARAHPGVCALELTFLGFDVEASDGCQYDYLKLQDERLCGVYPANLKRIIPFEDADLKLEFHSDGATTRPGFHIRGQQMDCAPLPPDKVVPPPSIGYCDVTFTNVSGTFQTPRFPETYPPSSKCMYRFVAQPEFCRITFQFLEFGLQADNALCDKDFLKINGIKYCGPQLLGQKRTVTFYGYPREVNVTFESDELISDKGFYAIYRQLPCSPALARSPSQRTDAKPRACDRLYASLAFSILSPGHPDNYPADVECRYTVRRLGPRICRLKLSFRQFDVESSEGCEYDYLQVDGKKICGNLPANEIRMVEFRDYQTIFTFHSDSANSKPGFVIKVEQEECNDNSRGQQIPNQKGQQFQQPNPNQKGHQFQQPNFNQNGHQFQQPNPNQNGHQFQLPNPNQNGHQFQQPNFNQNGHQFQQPNPNQRGQQIPKFEAHFDLPPVVAEPPPQHIEEQYYVHQPPQHLDYEHLVDYPLYEASTLQRNMQVPVQNCDRTFAKSEFEIRSVNFPGPYPHGLNCRYLVRRASADICWVKLVFLRFDLEPSDDCHFDYLSVNGKRICGTLQDDEIRAYIFNSEEITMYFRSDGANAHRGFLIRGEQLKCKTKEPMLPAPAANKSSHQAACGRTFDRDLFVVQSPRFPDPYPPSSQCSWEVRKASRYVCGLQLTLLTFDVENEASCDRDYLQVDAGDRMCGPVPARTIRNVHFAGETVTMKFVSDNKNERPGFSILVQQLEDCENTKRSAPTVGECSQEYSAESFLVQSPGFPEEYPAQQNCEYRVRRRSSSHCRLELRVLSFDVEEGVDGKCDTDSLEIPPAGRRWCGQLQKDHTESVLFTDEEIVLTFRSDATTQRPGFSILVRQMTDCGASGNASIPTNKCGGVFSGEEFSLKSPNFPDDYPHDAHCEYVVRRQSDAVCGLELSFAHFDVEKGPDCTYDYLDIGHKTICGQLPSGFTRVIPFESGSEMKFTFRSDKGTSKSGFAIKVRQRTDCGTTWKPATPPLRMCDHCLKESRGHLISPDYPDNYPAGLQCTYHLQRVKGFCGLEIFFHDFKVQVTKDCRGDALTAQGERWCGDTLKGKMKKIDFPIGEPNEIILQFETDEEGSGQGFHAEYRQIPCRGYPWRQGRSMWTPSNASDWTNSE